MDYNEEPPPYCRSCDEWRGRAKELEAKLDSTIKTAIQLLSMSCQRHSEITRGLSFDEFRARYTFKCLMCTHEDLGLLGQLRNLLREWAGLLNRRDNLTARTLAAIEVTKDL